MTIARMITISQIKSDFISITPDTLQQVMLNRFRFIGADLDINKSTSTVRDFLASDRKIENR